MKDEVESRTSTSPLRPTTISNEFDKIFLQVMTHLDAEECRTARLISRATNSVFKKHLVKYFQFIVDEVSEDPALCDPVETLLKSEVPWETIVFRNMNLEERFMKDMQSFDNFVNKACNTLKILKFMSCQLSCGRFMEVLARLYALTSLSIQNSPSLFIVTASTLNWKHLYPSFVRTLEKLKYLTILNCDLNPESFHFYAQTCTKLMSINFETSEVSDDLAFPQNLIEPMAALSGTLKILNLSGRFFLANSDVDHLSQFNLLQFLSLSRFEIEDEEYFASRFLSSRVILRRLVFKNMRIGWKLFNGIENLWRLNAMSLIDCKYCNEEEEVDDVYCLVNLNDLDTLEMVCFQQSDSEDIVGVSEISAFFEVPRPTLKRLWLSGPNLGEVLENVASNCENLVTLQLDYVTLSPNHLQNIWKMKTLFALCIRNCQLSDDDIMHLEGLGTLSICDLQNLELLDLTSTSIGDITIGERVAYLQNLKVLNVSNTMITNHCLHMIASDREKLLPNLKIMDFYDCYRCEFSSIEEVFELEFKMEPVALNFNLDVPTEQGEILENDMGNETVAN